MKTMYKTPAALAIAIFLVACASQPTSTTQLESARSDFARAQDNPNVAVYAAPEMRQARDAMTSANHAADARDSIGEVDRLAYVAQQKIALTQEVTKQKLAEVDMARSAKERDQMRLDQRTAEADNANARAQQAQIATQVAQGDAAQAQRSADAAQRSADEARMRTAEAQAHSAQLEAQLADLQAKKTARGLVITLGDVLFASDQAALNPEGTRSAQKLADVLKQNPLRTVRVEGFTDSTGGKAHNQDLSERRGKSVREALLQMGVDGTRIQVQGFGESYPVAGNDTASNRQMNRRVEIVLSDDTGHTQARN